MSAISDVLWPGAKAEVGADLANGGIHVNKGGYHSDRNWLKANKPGDYSIQLAIDKLGPGSEGSAIDLTFRSAQAGDFRNIAKYSKRLLEAGKAKDPRAYPLREFQGNINDGDRKVDGWSFYRDHSLTTSDTSHLWHIHLSIFRKYINDEAAMRSILSIWEGEDMALSSEDIDKIADKVTARVLKALPAAVWDADVIPNVWGDAGTNANVRAKSALVEIGNDANAIRAKLQA